MLIIPKTGRILIKLIQIKENGQNLFVLPGKIMEIERGYDQIY